MQFILGTVVTPHFNFRNILTTSAPAEIVLDPDGVFAIGVYHRPSLYVGYYIALLDGSFAVVGPKMIASLVTDDALIAKLRQEYDATAAAKWLACDELKNFIMPTVFKVGFEDDFGYIPIRATSKVLTEQKGWILLIDPDRMAFPDNDDTLFVTQDRKVLVLRHGRFVPPYDEAAADAFFGDADVDTAA